MKAFWISLLLLFASTAYAVALRPPAGFSMRSSEYALLLPDALLERARERKIRPAKAPEVPPEPVIPKTAIASRETPKIRAPLQGEVVRESGPRILRRPDGTLLLDDFYELRGSGTREDPYRVTWDLLVSALETAKPSDGALVFPARLELLKDMAVELRGYTVVAESSAARHEFILNRSVLDDCCLLPPTNIFEVVEVRSAQAGLLMPGIVNAVTVRGTLRIDPLIRQGQVAGVYVLEDAELVLGR
ncbi:MAG: hypothetical protein HS116_25710 [Planctomycetes bacterium]|nr:hypothetical protein [Planctomycetota bacterium]